MKTESSLAIAPVGPSQAASAPHRGPPLCVGALLSALLFSACHRTASTAPSETPARADDPARTPDPAAAVKAAEPTELRQKVAEARKLAAGGSCDEAAARLLKMRIDSTKFSDKDAAAYREALQDTYSRALEAAGKGDPKGQAALEMIRAARGR